MQVRAESLEAALARRRPPVVWIHGDETLLRMEAADTVRAALRADGFEERKVFDVERGFRIETLAAETSALSLFATRKVIELRMTGKPGKELGFALGDLAGKLGDDVRLLVSSPRLDRATTESAWFRAIDDTGYAVPVHEVERTQLPAWIGQRLARQRQQADAATLALIAERVEGNLLAAQQEIRKLGLLLPTGALPAEAVRAAVMDVARYDTFDLAEAMLGSDLPRAMRTLSGLRAEGQAEPLVLWALADAVRTLLKLSQAIAAGRQAQQAMRELRIFGPRERTFERALRAAPPTELARRLTCALQQAAHTDRIVKGLERGDAWSSMQTLMLIVADRPAFATQDF
jgi:DNA polymerase-3 subunit delta